MNTPTSLTMTRVKRWIAAVAVVAALVAGLDVLGVSSLATQRFGADADPADAFVSTDPLAADVEWAPDADGLARPLGTEERAAVAAAWVRSHEALTRAAVGDASGLETSFVDGALEQASARADLTATSEWAASAPTVIEHELRLEFVSLDKQIIVVSAELDASDGVTSTVDSVLVQVDGMWRIRSLTQRAITATQS